LFSESTQQKLLTEIEQFRKLGAKSFPALVLMAGGQPMERDDRLY